MARNPLDRDRFSNIHLFELENTIRSANQSDWIKYKLVKSDINRFDVIFAKVYGLKDMTAQWIVYLVLGVRPLDGVGEVGRTYFFPPLSWVTNELNKIEKKLLRLGSV